MVTLTSRYYMPETRNPEIVATYAMYEAMLAEEIGIDRSFYNYFISLVKKDILSSVPGGDINFKEPQQKTFKKIRHTLLQDFQQYAEKITDFCKKELGGDADAEENSLNNGHSKCIFPDCGYEGKNPKRHCVGTHKMDPNEYDKQKRTKKGSHARPGKQCSLCGKTFKRLNQHLDTAHKDIKKFSSKYNKIIADGRKIMLANRKNKKGN